MKKKEKMSQGGCDVIDVPGQADDEGVEEMRGNRGKDYLRKLYESRPHHWQRFRGSISQRS